MQVTVDRIEEGFAIMLIRPSETEEFSLSLRYLPEGITEGDIIDITFNVNKSEKKATKNRVKDLLAKLKNKK